MKIEANTPEEYIEQLPEDRKEPMRRLRQIILDNLPKGFEEQMSYGMLGYVVPHSIYPKGYHVNPKLPLPFINLASQKNNISLYHSGVYADNALMQWFTDEYGKIIKTKLDKGKSCLRFKKIDQLPYDLIGELVSKMTVEQWIEIYEAALKK